MLEGKCSRCGTYRRGWALLNPRYQTCPKCGVGLDITEDGGKVFKGFSPFSADRIDSDPTSDITPSSDKDTHNEKKPPTP